MSDFDPSSERQHLLLFGLPRLDFQPWRQPPTRIAAHVLNCVRVLARCYWVGLADIARPKLKAILEWLDEQKPPSLNAWSGHKASRVAPWSHRLFWWQSVALARWLVHDDPACADFARALDAEQKAWAKAKPADRAREQQDRQETVREGMAMALTAGRPSVGLRLYEDAEVCTPGRGERSVLDFGHWACAHLAAGGLHDPAFVARGAVMLKHTLPAYLMNPLTLIEPTLWLKAIYFDSGVTRTAEATILRAYDLIPGVTWPAVEPRHLH